tara:strand:- start:638 stop:1687 length:1050 start_codon:yes stop_codon:yes gene_type:complete
MGVLRKIGGKVNRALGKVFGEKVGSLIGSIGMSMVMWQGAKMLFPGTTEAIQTFAENTKNAVFGSPTEAVLEVTKNIDPNLINNTTTPITGGKVPPITGGEVPPITGGEVPPITGGEVSGAGAKTGAGGSILDSSVITDPETLTATPQLSPTATDAIKKDALLKPEVDFTEDIFADAGSNLVGEPGATFTPEPNSIQMMDTKAKDLAGNVVGGLDTSAIKDFKGTPIDIDAAYAQNKNIFAKGAGKLKDYVTEGNFVGDVGKGVATSVIMQEIAGDPEDMFAGGGVAGQPISEAAQGNYMRDVGPSAMAATGMTRMPSFQELSQQTLYGTGAPNFMAQFYQPLATPRMG